MIAYYCYNSSKTDGLRGRGFNLKLARIFEFFSCAHNGLANYSAHYLVRQPIVRARKKNQHILANLRSKHVSARKLENVKALGFCVSSTFAISLTEIFILITPV